MEPKSSLPLGADAFRLRNLPDDVRAFRVKSPDTIGKTPSWLRETTGTSVLRTLRAGEALDAAPDLPVERGDVPTVRNADLVTVSDRGLTQINPFVARPVKLGASINPPEVSRTLRSAVGGMGVAERACRASPGL